MIVIFIGFVLVIAFVRQGVEVRKLERKMERLNINQTNTVCRITERCNDADKQIKEVQDMWAADSTNIWNEFLKIKASIVELEPKLSQAEREKAEELQDEKIADQWEKVINFNPLKEIEKYGN